MKIPPTIPGYKWLCRDCEFETEEIMHAVGHGEEKGCFGHWLYEYPNGDRKLPPAREMHTSDAGGSYVTIVMKGVNQP